jgi:hypothetical protein
LSADIPENRNAADRSSGIKVLKKESMSARDHILLPREPGLNQRIRAVEICTRCGAPVIDKSRIFCTNCTAYVRDISSKGESLIVHQSVLKSLDKKPVAAPEICQEAETRTIKEQEPVLVQGTSNPLHPKATGWKLIIILAGIAIFFVMVMLVVMFMFSLWRSLS